MAAKFIVLAVLVAAANAGIYDGIGFAAHAPLAVAHAAPAVVAAPVAHKVIAPAVHKTVQVDYYDAHPQYNYEYSVHDAHTGDVKTQQEHRDGDVVQGSYSLVEPDGSRRVVHYTADPHNGFNAVVQREHNAHPAAAIVKTVAAAPAILKTVAAAPAYVSHAAPLLSHGYHG